MPYLRSQRPIGTGFALLVSEPVRGASGFKWSTFSKNGTNGGGEPVRLDAWVASKHPRLHPTRRMVLKVVASLCRDGEWATSSEVRESTDLSQQLLNRHLRGLESDGMIRIVKPGPGLPLNVRPTSMGLRLLGQAESRQVSEEPSWEEPQEQYQPQAEPEAQTPAESDGVSSLWPAACTSNWKSTCWTWTAARPRSCWQQTLRELGGNPRAPAPAAEPAGAETLTSVWSKSRLRARAKSWRPSRRPSRRIPGPAPAAPAQPGGSHPGGKAPPHRPRRIPQHHLVAAHPRPQRHLGPGPPPPPGSFDHLLHLLPPPLGIPRVGGLQPGPPPGRRPGSRLRRLGAGPVRARPKPGDQDLAPRQLHGEKAIRAYQESRPAHQQASPTLGAPPFSLDSFDLNDPSHVAYAEALLDQLDHLAQRVYGDDPVGPVNLLVEAVWRATCPCPPCACARVPHRGAWPCCSGSIPISCPRPSSQAAQEQPPGKRSRIRQRAVTPPCRPSLRTPLII